MTARRRGTLAALPPLEADAVEAAAGAAAANAHEHERQSEWMPAGGFDGGPGQPPLAELAAVEQSLIRRAIPALKNRWPALIECDERLASLDVHAGGLAARIEQLRERLRHIDAEDADRFRQWVESGAQGERPEVQRPAAEAQLYDLEREAEGVRLAIERVERERVGCIVKHRRSLVRDSTALVERRRAEAEAALAEAERARQALCDAAEVKLWSRVYPDASASKVPPYGTLGAGQTVANATLGVDQAIAASTMYAAMRADIASVVDVLAPEHRQLLTDLGEAEAVDDPTAAAWVAEDAGKSQHRREIEAWMEAYRREYGALPAEHQLEAFIAQHQQAGTLPTL